MNYINPASWTDVSDHGDRSRLLTTIRILGCPMHLEAIALRWNAESTQETTTEEHAEYWRELALAFGSDDPWDTVEIEGAMYGIFAQPFANGDHHRVQKSSRIERAQRKLDALDPFHTARDGIVAVPSSDPEN